MRPAFTPAQGWSGADQINGTIVSHVTHTDRTGATLVKYMHECTALVGFKCRADWFYRIIPDTDIHVRYKTERTHISSNNDNETSLYLYSNFISNFSNSSIV